MEYKYYNQFNLSDELAETISAIISQKANDNYVCKIITVIIQEHKGIVLWSPNYEPWGGGLKALSGAQMQARTGEFIEGTVPEEEYTFFVVMKDEAFKSFSALLFNNKKEMEKTLRSFSVICESYSGIFDSKKLIQIFPYLQDFFTYLDEWRAETGRVTIDAEVLEKGMQKCISESA